MRVLITGGGGFLASHLANYLQTQPSLEVRSLTRAECDLANDVGRLSSLVRMFGPQRIFHLAGRTSGSKETLFRDNLRATAAVLEAAKRLPRTRVLLSSTTAVYGAGGTEDAPLREDETPIPKGDYAASKYEAEQLASQSGVDVLIARISNPIGAGMSSEMLCGTLAKQIVDIEGGAKTQITLRSLVPKRDFLGVGDCIRALWQLSEKGERGGIYNVAVGTSISIAEVVKVFLELSRVRRIEVLQRNVENQRSGILEQWVSSDKLKSLGWRPGQSLPEVIAELLESERRRL